MIFNTKEFIDVLSKCIYNPYLNDKDIQTIKTLIVYLDSGEPKLTLDEFNALFNCNMNLKLNKDKSIQEDAYGGKTIEVEITPKIKFYMKVYDSVDINPEIKEHLQSATYQAFINYINNELKEE